MDGKEIGKEPVAQTPTGSSAASRMSAYGAILDRIGRLRREADQLEALLDILPRVLPVGADEGLWKLVVGFRH